MTVPSCVIADDEPNLRQQLRDALRSAWPELRVAAEVEDGLAALEAIQTHAPDVAFLDIKMPGLTGLRLAETVSGRCHVVFVTAYDEYAVAAFEAGVVDYVLKPVELTRLVRVVERLKGRIGGVPASIEATLAALAVQAPRRLEWVQAVAGKQTRFIPVEDVVYFRSDTKYTRVSTVTGEAFVRTPIKELALLLDDNIFWQTHRGTIVNTRFLHGVERDDDGNLEVLLRGRPERLPVSHAFQHRFRPT